MPTTKKFISSDSLYLKKLRFDPALYQSFIHTILSSTRIVILAILALLLAGTYSLITLPRELNPEVKIPIVTVVTSFPGATPLDVEELVTKKLEKEINTIPNINTLSSASQENVSVITVEFVSSADPDKSYDQVKEKVDIVTDLPDDVNTPRVTKLDFNNQPVLQVALVGDLDRHSLSQVAEHMQEVLERNSGIRKVDISGREEDELVIALKPEALTTYGLSAGQILQTIKSSDVTIPAGTVQINDTRYQISVNNSVTDSQAVRQLPLALNNGGYVQLGEVADVFYRAKENNQLVTFTNHTLTDAPAMQLWIYKTENATITGAAQAALNTLNTEIEQYPQVQVVNILNSAELIDDQFIDLGFNFRDTVILVFLTLFIFLGFRQATIASLSIPLTLLSAFVIMNIVGITLNFLSLFSLLLALGLIVDDAIVIVQASHQYSAKFKPMEMGLLVFRDFIVPIWSTTITTVWAFLPLLLASGIIGEFIKSIPVVVSAALLSSTTIAVLINLPMVVLFSKLEIPSRVKIFFGVLGLILSLVIVGLLTQNSVLQPVVLLLWLLTLIVSWWLRKEIAAKTKVATHTLERRWPLVSSLKQWFKRSDLFNQGLLDFSKVSERYRGLLRKILLKTRYRIYVYTAASLFFIISIVFLVTGLLKSEFFPKTDQDQLYINIEGPAGWPLERTNAAVREVEQKIHDIPEIKYVVSETNRLSSAGGFGSSSAGPQLANMTIVLPKAEDRSRSSIEIANEIRQRLAPFNQAKVTIIEETGGPPVGADLQVNIYGDDLESLEQVSQDFMKIIGEIPGAINIDTSLKQNAGQIKIVLQETELAERGLSVVEVAQWLRTAVTGTEAGSFTVNQDDITMTITAQDETQTLSALQHVVLPFRGGQYTLAEVANLSLEVSPAVVNRQNNKRVVTVTAAAQGVSATELFKDFQEKAKEHQLPTNMSWDVGGVNEENQASTLSIIQAMGISAILILVTMVLQFNSFRKSLLVLMVIPLAVAGVFFNFTLVGIPLSFASLIGVLALFGIVVNNSMMLVDKINQNIRIGLPFIEAVVDACTSRVEAIFFTTLTTIMGLLPITLADPFWRGLGGAIIAGLSVSGTLILFVLPAMYVEIYRKSEGATQTKNKV